MTVRVSASHVGPGFNSRHLHHLSFRTLFFSSVVHLLLQAFVQGTVHIGVSQYPEKYLQTLKKSLQN